MELQRDEVLRATQAKTHLLIAYRTSMREDLASAVLSTEHYPTDKQPLRRQFTNERIPPPLNSTAVPIDNASNASFPTIVLRGDSFLRANQASLQATVVPQDIACNLYPNTQEALAYQQETPPHTVINAVLTSTPPTCLEIRRGLPEVPRMAEAADKENLPPPVGVDELPLACPTRKCNQLVFTVTTKAGYTRHSRDILTFTV